MAAAIDNNQRWTDGVSRITTCARSMVWGVRKKKKNDASIPDLQLVALVAHFNRDISTLWPSIMSECDETKSDLN